MTHRVDLKILGYESAKMGSKKEVEKYKDKFDKTKYLTKVVPVGNDTWELYIKQI